MIIGLLKEIKKDEFRVPIIPKDITKIVKEGHEVIFEPNCGKMAGYPDKEYKRAGALPKDKDFIFKNADIVVKLKTPQGIELERFSKGQILFSYLHYDGNESLEGAEKLRKSGVIAIAFEWVEEQGPEYPLLKPMSELTGTLAAIKSLEIYRIITRKIAGSFSENIKPATIMIIGLGTIGTNALNVFLHQGIQIIIFDKNPESIEERVLEYIPKYIWLKYKNEIKVVKSDEENIKQTKEDLRKELPNIDILFFSAVRRSTFKEDHLIDKEMLNLMKENSILIDAGANDKDLVESSISSPEIHKIYKINNVWHYVNDHIPTIAANDASRILSHAILPYLMKLIKGDPINAILENSSLLKGTIIAGYQYTHKYTCRKKNIPYIPIKIAIKNYFSHEKSIKRRLKTI